MRQVIRRVLANPAVKMTLMSAMGELVSVYGKALTNVLKRKLGVYEEQDSNVITVEFRSENKELQE